MYQQLSKLGKYRGLIILLLLGGIYYAVVEQFGVGFVCPVYFILHLYCPGCGVTRLIMHLLHGEFYLSFRSNMAVYILTLPTCIGYFMEHKFNQRKAATIVYAAVLVLLLIFGVLRNIYPILAPV
jgi:hypothetical protein